MPRATEAERISAIEQVLANNAKTRGSGSKKARKLRNRARQVFEHHHFFASRGK